MKVLLALVCVISSLGLYAQNQQVHVFGTVRTGASKPVAFALVRVKLGFGGSDIGFAYADSAGDYDVIIEARNDSVTLEVSRIGYETVYRTVAGHLDHSVRADVVMVEAVKGLPPVNITVAPKIIHKGDTTIYNADAYKTVDQRNLADLLKRMPGFAVTDEGKLSYNGKPIDRVLIEGDDLFEDKYETLVNNISPDGLDKVAVIQHYKDKSNLSNALSQGNEQVLDLKFKKKRAVRTFGAVSVAGGPNGEYENRGNILGVVPKAKVVLTADMNTIGKTSDMAMDDQNGEGRNGEDGRFFGPLMSVQEISSRDLGVDRFTFSTTRYATANVLYTPSDVLRVKFMGNMGFDDIWQYSYSSQTYYTQSPYLTFTEDDTLHNKHRFGWADLNVNYTPGRRLQLEGDMSLLYGRNNARTDELLDSVQNSQCLRQRMPLYAPTFRLTYLVGENDMFNVKARGQWENVPETFGLTPFANDSIYSVMGNFDRLTQRVERRSEVENLAMTYAHKSTLGTFEGSIEQTEASSRLASSTTLYNDADSSYTFGGGFSNAQKYRDESYLTKITYNSPKAKYVNYWVSLGAAHHDLSLEDTGYASTLKEKKFFPYFSGSVSYQMGAYSSLSVEYGINSQMPSESNLVRGYLFRDYHTLWNGIGSLQTGIGHAVNVNYSFNDLFRKKILLLLGGIVKTDPALYVSDLYTSENLIVNKTVPNDQRNFLGVGFGRLEKLLPKISSRVVVTLSYNYMEKWNAVAGALFKNKMQGGLIDLDYKSSFDKVFNVDVSAKVRLSSQQAGSDPVNQTWDYIVSVTPHFSLLSKKLVISTNDLLLRSASNFSGTKSVNLVDANVDYRFLRGKLDCFVQCRNIFNEKTFSENFTTGFYYQTSGFLLRRIGVAGVSFIF